MGDPDITCAACEKATDGLCSCPDCKQARAIQAGAAHIGPARRGEVVIRTFTLRLIACRDPMRALHLARRSMRRLVSL